MTTTIPLDVALFVSFLMACAFQIGRIVEREKAERRRRTATATRYRNR